MSPVLRPVPGDGVLARRGELLLLASIPDDSAPDDSGDAVRALLAAQEQVAAASADGWLLADAVAGLLGDLPVPVDVVVLGPSRGTLAVAVFGDAFVDATTGQGRLQIGLQRTRLGARAVLPGSIVSARAGLGATPQDEPSPFIRLDEGVTRAGGLLLTDR